MSKNTITFNGTKEECLNIWWALRLMKIYCILNESMTTLTIEDTSAERKEQFNDTIEVSL